jgi:DNA helicase IV
MHPDLPAEQRHLDRAYERLEELRDEALQMVRVVMNQNKGTPQFLEERDALVRFGLRRLAELDLGDEAICFGRIDLVGQGGTVERYHLGRVGIHDRDMEPLVVDWRAPVAEPFYRATGRDPMGLLLRRHLAVEHRKVVGIEDERFAAAGPKGDDELELGGPGALLAAIEQPRSGEMRHIVATIQREQDEVIRQPLAGVLVVQGGPGMGKTAVALHRAAYLLYTYRFPLERQGVLVVGPNPLFLRYIGRVLPSLGETGVTLSTIHGLVAGVRAVRSDPPDLARLKGDERMAVLLARAVRTRERPLKQAVAIPFGGTVLHMEPEATREAVALARQRPGPHNPKRRVVEHLLLRHLRAQLERRRASHRPANGRDRQPEGAADLDELRRVREFRLALERIWPVLDAETLIGDLFGSPALLRVAARGLLAEHERDLLARPRPLPGEPIELADADLPLVDEARSLLGPPTPADERSEIWSPRRFGHIVVDEAQDLTPMELRMLARRSIGGSMTLAGDLAQATGPHVPDSWEDLTRHLQPLRPPRVVELTVSYRTPAEVLELAGRLLPAGTRPPRALRRTGVEPSFVRTDPPALATSAARLAAELASTLGSGTVGLIAPPSLVGELSIALDAMGEALQDRTSLLPADLAHGLEFEGVVVVEPSAIAAELSQGMRALYVALTRPTRRLVVVHAEPLPPPLAEAATTSS